MEYVLILTFFTFIYSTLNMFIDQTTPFDVRNIKTFCVTVHPNSRVDSAHSEGGKNVMSTTNTVNGKMDSKRTPSAGDLLNVQS